MSKDKYNETRIDMDEWEAQVNALLDGELDDVQAEALKTRAESDQALARAIIEAYQLQRLMHALPVERAPDSLREKLRRIPAEQESLAMAHSGRRKAMERAPRRWFRFEPRWAMALAAVPLVVVVGLQLSGPRAPSDAELAQARQDLALAFSYLRRPARSRAVKSNNPSVRACAIWSRKARSAPSPNNLI